MSEDKNLFGEYFEKYKDDVYRVAFYYTGNRDDAEDLVQNAFIRAHNFFSHFKKDTNFKSWILKIMRNIYITENKKKGRYKELFTEVEISDSNSKSLTEELIDNVATVEVRKAILMLPKEFREVIILSDIEGLMYEDIARIIKIPVGTVRSRLHRGRLLLKEKLEGKINAE